MNENNLCSYYNFENSPGIKIKGKFITEKFAYLEDETTIKNLVQFRNDNLINITFSLPQIHCSSCVYLLENLHHIEEGINCSQTNFLRKEVFISFNPAVISLRKVVELLAYIGYEPVLSLQVSSRKNTASLNKKVLYQIGVAGFCFANIMMLSFPEYFASGNIAQTGLRNLFIKINFILSLPVLFYCAAGFFIAAIKGLRQKSLNIDLPIALAIAVTFGRSYVEIFFLNGVGFLDSGSGIVFFMLIGRWFQQKTTQSFSFDRDYKDYFPLGVSLVNNGDEKVIPVSKLKQGDHIIIRNQEMIPGDAILSKGVANIDYSFVSGERMPLLKNKGDIIYAGGKQIGSAIELILMHTAAQSYLTQLWNNDIFNHKKNSNQSFIHPWSKYFTIVLFAIALVTTIAWTIIDPTKILPAVTSVLIVACPCSLLLAATFTHGNMLRIYGKNKLFLKNATVIDSMAKTENIIFDKTGTITTNDGSTCNYIGRPLSKHHLSCVYTITHQSANPYCKIIAANTKLLFPDQNLTIDNFNEFSGKGVEGFIGAHYIKIGSANFVSCSVVEKSTSPGSRIYISINKEILGVFTIGNLYRSNIATTITILQKKYMLQVLSGDNNGEKDNLTRMFGHSDQLYFNQSPQNKLEFIRQLQLKGNTVLMIGDGLNDAGALRQSNTGIAVSDDKTFFAPACDAIIDGSKVYLLDKFLRYSKMAKVIIRLSFTVSIGYNIIGLSFAVRGVLSPIIAAILMPVSSISVVLLVTLLSSLAAKKIGLKT